MAGRLAIANPRRNGDDFARGFSVQSAFGAYGLYYRSPLIAMGLAVPLVPSSVMRRHPSMW